MPQLQSKECMTMIWWRTLSDSCNVLSEIPCKSGSTFITSNAALAPPNLLFFVVAQWLLMLLETDSCQRNSTVFNDAVKWGTDSRRNKMPWKKNKQGLHLKIWTTRAARVSFEFYRNRFPWLSLVVRCSEIYQQWQLSRSKALYLGHTVSLTSN